MPKSQTRPGDATGREKERLQQEHAAALKAAATTTTLTTPPVVEQTDEIVDYSKGGTPNPGENPGTISTDEARAQGAVLSIDDLPDNEIDTSSLPDGRTDLLSRPDVVLDEPRPAAERFQPQQPQQAAPPVTVKQALEGGVQGEAAVEMPRRVMRVNTDLEDITIGKDNHFTFRENKRYVVEQYVYDHLDEKGYVYH